MSSCESRAFSRLILLAKLGSAELARPKMSTVSPYAIYLDQSLLRLTIDNRSSKPVYQKQYKFKTGASIHERLPSVNNYQTVFSLQAPAPSIGTAQTSPNAVVTIDLYVQRCRHRRGDIVGGISTDTGILWPKPEESIQPFTISSTTELVICVANPLPAMTPACHRGTGGCIA